MKCINKIWFVVLPAIIMGVACTNIGYEKTKSGMEYKIFKSEKPGASLKHGDVVKFEIKITFKDSLLGETYGSVPGYTIVDSVGRPHDFSEILKLMKVGDSAVTIQLYDSLLAANPQGGPTFMKKGDKLKTTLKILAVFTTQETAMVDYQAEMDKYRLKQIAEVEAYITKNNLKVDKLKSVFVQVIEKGSGPAADSGKVVSVKYTGYTLAGRYFDSNIDSTKQTQRHSMEPFTFVSKQQGAIPGMLEAITSFNKGGKGKMFIPSFMGYGQQGNLPGVLPNEHLIFDIEVVDVQDMPQQPAMQMPPNGGNPNGGNN
jgi:FKBP-type peptidyl-prolyl cis-trans isomerase FkpA